MLAICCNSSRDKYAHAREATANQTRRLWLTGSLTVSWLRSVDCGLPAGWGRRTKKKEFEWLHMWICMCGKYICVCVARGYKMPLKCSIKVQSGMTCDSEKLKKSETYKEQIGEKEFKWKKKLWQRSAIYLKYGNWQTVSFETWAAKAHVHVWICKRMCVWFCNWLLASDSNADTYIPQYIKGAGDSVASTNQLQQLVLKWAKKKNSKHIFTKAKEIK